MQHGQLTITLATSPLSTLPPLPRRRRLLPQRPSRSCLRHQRTRLAQPSLRIHALTGTAPTDSNARPNFPLCPSGSTHLANPPRPLLSDPPPPRQTRPRLLDPPARGFLLTRLPASALLGQQAQTEAGPLPCTPSPGSLHPPLYSTSRPCQHGHHPLLRIMPAGTLPPRGARRRILFFRPGPPNCSAASPIHAFPHHHWPSLQHPGPRPAILQSSILLRVCQYLMSAPLVEFLASYYSPLHRGRFTIVQPSLLSSAQLKVARRARHLLEDPTTSAPLITVPT